MFVVKAQSPTFSAPVPVQLLDEQTTHHFEATFRLPTEQELVDLRGLTDLELSRSVMVGWDKVADQDKQPLAFSGEAREALLAMVPVPSCVAYAFHTHISGARVKNLNPPRESGRAAE